MLLRILILSILFFSKISMAIEEPKYTISEKESPFEVRRYDPILIAEVFVEGSRDEASNKGFRMIADFIFGNKFKSIEKTGNAQNEKSTMNKVNKFC